MDASEFISDALEDLPSARDPSHRMSLLNGIHDRIEFNELEVGFLESAAESLVNLIVFEKDRDVRNRMFDCIECAYHRNLSINPSLDLLIAMFNDSDPALIANTLLLMAYSSDRKHIPVAQAYVSHSNPFIRQNAEHALKYLQ
jgi:hypothetical protein